MKLNATEKKLLQQMYYRGYATTACGTYQDTKRGFDNLSRLGIAKYDGIRRGYILTEHGIKFVTDEAGVL